VSLRSLKKCLLPLKGLLMGVSRKKIGLAPTRCLEGEGVLSLFDECDVADESSCQRNDSTCR